MCLVFNSFLESSSPSHSTFIRSLCSPVEPSVIFSFPILILPFSLITRSPNSPLTPNPPPNPLTNQSRFNLPPKRLPLHLPNQQEHHLDVRWPFPSLSFRSIHHPAPHPLHLQPRPHRPLLLLHVWHKHLRCEREARFLPGSHCSECEFFSILLFHPLLSFFLPCTSCAMLY